MHSSTIRERALKLRLRGKSYNEISSNLSISKSTLHSWLEKVQLSKKARNRINLRRHEGSMRGLLKRNKLQTHRARQRAALNRQIGKDMIQKTSRRELLIIGAALYWGEGYKRAHFKDGRKLTHHTVSLSNADADLVRVFLNFLRNCFKIKDEEIAISLHLYDHINQQEAIRFWQKATNLPSKQFSRIYYGVSIASQRRRKYNRLPYGTAQVRVNSTPLYHQIMGLIEGISEEAKL